MPWPKTDRVGSPAAVEIRTHCSLKDLASWFQMRCREQKPSQTILLIYGIMNGSSEMNWCFIFFGIVRSVQLFTSDCDAPSHRAAMRRWWQRWWPARLVEVSPWRALADHKLWTNENQHVSDLIVVLHQLLSNLGFTWSICLGTSTFHQQVPTIWAWGACVTRRFWRRQEKP